MFMCPNLKQVQVTIEPPSPLLKRVKAEPEESKLSSKADDKGVRSTVYERPTEGNAEACKKAEIHEFGALMSDLTPELAEVCKVIKLDISSEKQHPINMLIAKFQSLLIDNLFPKMPVLDQLLNCEATSSGLMEGADEQKLAQFSRITHQRLSKSKHRNQLHSAVRATQLGGKVRSTFNNERFEDLSPEVIYAEVILLEIQQAVGFIYGSAVRFYMSVIGTGELDQMKEDLIEVVTSTTISGQLGDICLKLCRLSTRQEERDLAKQYALFWST